ncbi:MAG: DNA primase [Clostridiales Family XIII bacterium]|nr:DNA primase [Clostridiales Family XIII bacterium]
MKNGGNIADEIKSRCNIVDVVGRLVQLKKTGANHTGLCPFHNEKTPSFTVSEDRQRFVCYGCGASGDVIEFVKRTQNLSFLEAAEKLAEEYGIEWAPAAFDTDGRKAAYYEANREAATFFYHAFRRLGNPALPYMARRGVDDATLRAFGVGYADGEWDSLCRALSEKGVDEKLALSLGLCAVSGERRYDRFRNRVMFPIINTRGKIIGFGGRALGDDGPKYLNSPDSRIYHKKDSLYALNVTSQEIRKADRAILVEGYMDVISLYRHGVRNVTASLGTALTQGQAAMLKRYTDNVVMAYDADEAGRAAAMRGMDVLREAGCAVKALRMEGAKDPDEYIKANGRERFMGLLDEALPYMDYRIGVERDRHDISSTEGSLAFLKAVAGILRKASPVEAEIYIKKVSSETRISEGAIRAELSGAGAPGGRQAPAWTPPGREARAGGQSRAASAGAPAGSMPERNFIRLLLSDSGYLPRIMEYERVFVTPALFRIYSAIAGMCADGSEPDMRRLADSLDEECLAALADIRENVHLAGSDEDVFDGCVRALRLKELSERENEIILLLTVANEEDGPERIRELTQELLGIQREAKGVKGR